MTELAEKALRIIAHSEQIYVRAEIKPGIFTNISLHTLALLNPALAFTEAFKLLGIENI